MSEQKIFYTELVRLQATVNGVKKELDNIVESLAPKTPLKRVKRKSEKEKAFEMYDKMYSHLLNKS